MSGDWLNPAPLATGAAAELSPPPPRPPPVTVLSHDCAHMTGTHTHTPQSYMCMGLFDKAD